MKKIFSVIDRVILWIENIVSVACLAGIVCITFANTIARYVFNSGFLWADELNQALLVAMAMFGCARAVRYNGHTEFDTVSNMPKKKGVRMAIRAAISVLTIGFLIFLLINSAQYTASGTMLSTVLKVPRMYYYMSIPIGFGLSIYEYLRTFKKRIVTDRADYQQ